LWYLEVMAEPHTFPPVKLVCGIISSSDRVLAAAESRLQEAFGPIDSRSRPYDFNWTSYYEPEMGPGLTRMFLSFERLVRPEGLAAVKLRTNGLEEDLRRSFDSPGRVANLDPGHLNSAALIMATAKPFSHRVPLSSGIYAHLELLFTRKEVRTLPWTYPDLRSGAAWEFFREVRIVYLAQLGPARRHGEEEGEKEDPGG
jgi:hypothetical protein